MAATSWVLSKYSTHKRKVTTMTKATRKKMSKAQQARRVKEREKQIELGPTDRTEYKRDQQIQRCTICKKPCSGTRGLTKHMSFYHPVVGVKRKKEEVKLKKTKPSPKPAVEDEMEFDNVEDFRKEVHKRLRKDLIQSGKIAKANIAVQLPISLSSFISAATVTMGQLTYSSDRANLLRHLYSGLEDYHREESRKADEYERLNG
jgi:hypothetical protein